MSDTTPFERWSKVLDQHGLNQNSLARAADVSPGTINRLVHGKGRPDTATVRAVAGVLFQDDTDAVWDLIGTGHYDYGDFDLADLADELRLLTPTQRDAMVAMVRSMADPKGKRTGTWQVASSEEDDGDEGTAGGLSIVPDPPDEGDGGAGAVPDLEETDPAAPTHVERIASREKPEKGIEGRRRRRDTDEENQDPGDGNDQPR